MCSQVKRGGVNEFQREREGGFEKGETGKGGGGTEEEEDNVIS